MSLTKSFETENQKSGPPDFKRAEQAAYNLIREFGYYNPPVDPARIAREMGIKVFFVEFDGEDSLISGYYNYEDNSIKVNVEEYPRRQTFTIAHELGHKVLHEEWARSGSYQVLMRDQSANRKLPVEREADAFAAHLLVPRKMLKRYIHEDVGALATLFAVSRPVIVNRIKNEPSLW